MKVAVAIISMGLLVLFLGPGCSSEEPALPLQEEVKMVKPIKRPVPEEVQVSLAGEEERPEPEIEAGLDNGPESEVPAKSQKENEPEGKPKPEEGESGEIETTVAEDKPMKATVTATVAEETLEEEAAGHYIVKKGESLSGIAAKQEIYANPLKWILLYKHNMETLRTIELTDNFPRQELPEGTKLRFITSDEAKENLGDKGGHMWVVNVQSETTEKRIVPTAVKLTQNGYPAYVTSASMEGKEWMRIRVGFFKNKAEADMQGQKIMQLLGFTNSWSSKIGKNELEEFGGY
jgi:cell division septation protein DedD